MSSRAFLNVGLVLALGVLGCSVERGTGRFPDLDQGGGPDISFTDASEPEQTLELSGKWLLFTEDRRCIFPDVGDEVENIVWTFYLVDFSTREENPSVVNLESHMCYQYLSPLPFGFVTVVPRSVINSLSPLEFVGFLVGGGQGAPFVTEQVVDLWGYREEQGDSSLPLSVEDQRIFDQDDDGLPGVSLAIETVEGNSICDVRVVQRTAFALEGTVIDGRTISGAFNVIPEQTILSASSSLCSTGEVFPSTGGNRFELIRLPDDLANCGAVRDNLDRIRNVLKRPENTPDASTYCAPMSP